MTACGQFSARVAVAAFVLSGCSTTLPEGRPVGAAAESLAPSLIDPAIPPAIAGEQGWNYAQYAEADLDGDGQAEQAVLAARVETVRGRPAWDDGQPWQVYVEEADGTRTHVYARRLQLGTLTLRLGRAAPAAPVQILLIEHLPDRLVLYEVAYAGPGQAHAIERFVRLLDPRGDLASPRFP